MQALGTPRARLSRAAVLLGALLCGPAGEGPVDLAARQQPGADLSRRPQTYLDQKNNRIETKHLVVRTSASAAAVAPGEHLELYVDVAPKPKMHVYTPEQKNVIPISLTLEPAHIQRSEATRFPESEKYFFEPLEETQFVYSKPFRLVRPITLAQSAGLSRLARAHEAVTLTGTLRYQACDDTICYLPQEVPLSWTIALKPPPDGRASPATIVIP